MEFSKYQIAIFQHVKDVTDGRITSGKRHVRVDALAGSGKSTTAKQLLKYIPHNQEPLFVAFNRLIADALTPEVPKLHPLASASTLHSFGLRTLRGAIRGLRVNQYKLDDILQANFYDMQDRSQKAEYFRFRNPAKRIVSLLKATATHPEAVDGETIDEIIDTYGIEIPGDKAKITILARDLFQVSVRSIETVKEIDFDDMIYGPSYLKLQPKKYDWVIVDEFQDFNLAQLNLVMACGKDGVIITFGDPHQAIYNFAGAHSGIMDMFRDDVGATVLPLSVCYRCPSTVLNKAREIVPEIEDAPDAAPGYVGSITEADFEHTLPKQNKPVVLSRYTAPAVSWCLKMIRNGVKATVKGRDIGQNLSALIEKIDTTVTGADFTWKVNMYKATELERLNRLGREEAIEQFTDKMDTITALISGIEGKDEVTVSILNKKIESIFSDSEHKDGILFSTIHKSKGLEFETVYILPTRGRKSKKAPTEAQKQEEINLQYVAITRSKSRLIFVNPSTVKE